MKLSRIAVTGALVAAVYEFAAIWTDELPTLTDMIEINPIVEVVVVGGLIGWILWHFGWLKLKARAQEWWEEIRP